MGSHWTLWNMLLNVFFRVTDAYTWEAISQIELELVVEDRREA